MATRSAGCKHVPNSSCLLESLFAYKCNTLSMCTHDHAFIQDDKWSRVWTPAGQTGSPPQQFIKGEKQIYSGWSSKGWRNLWNRAHSRTISLGSLFKGEDNKCILVWRRAKWGDIVYDPTVAGVKSHTATETFSPQIKVNTIASVLKSGQNLVLFILLDDLSVSEVPAPPLIFTNFRRSWHYVTPVSASRSEP